MLSPTSQMSCQQRQELIPPSVLSWLVDAVTPDIVRGRRFASDVGFAILFVAADEVVGCVQRFCFERCVVASHINLKLGMFPLRLTVLNTDYSTPYCNPD